MPEDVFMEAVRRMFYLSTVLSLPVLGTALVVGLVIGLLQAITSIQEQTLSFVPKLIAIVVMLVIAGPWMMRLIMEYTSDVILSLPKFGGL
jgi:flagellar biosynthetic protein FliQ